MAAVFTRGSTGGITVSLKDEDGVAISIEGQTRVRVAFAETVDADESLLSWDTEDSSDVGYIVVQENPAQVTVYLAEVDSLALPIGVLVCQVWVTINGREQASRVFKVRVIEGVGEPT